MNIISIMCRNGSNFINIAANIIIAMTNEESTLFIRGFV